MKWWSSSHTPRGAYICDGVGWAQGSAKPPEDLAPSQTKGVAELEACEGSGIDGPLARGRCDILTFGNEAGIAIVTLVEPIFGYS